MAYNRTKRKRLGHVFWYWQWHFREFECVCTNANVAAGLGTSTTTWYDSAIDLDQDLTAVIESRVAIAESSAAVCCRTVSWLCSSWLRDPPRPIRKQWTCERSVSRSRSWSPNAFTRSHRAAFTRSAAAGAASGPNQGLEQCSTNPPYPIQIRGRYC